jgi:hypothetical protein
VEELNYPEPMVDLESANRQARDLLWAVRKPLRHDRVTKDLLTKHGSRTNTKPAKSQNPKEPEQLSFDF